MENNSAKKLCAVSLICYIAPTILFIIALICPGEKSLILLLILELIKIAGVGIIIVGRIKYSDFLGCRIILWIYIAVFVIKLVFLKVLFSGLAAFGDAMKGLYDIGY